MNCKNISIQRLSEPEIRETSLLLAESMCTNPNLVSIFGKSNPAVIEQERKMFEMVLANPESVTYTAKLGDTIIGSMTYLSSKHCQMRKSALLKSLPAFIRMFGRKLFPVLKWQANWAKHDYGQPHVHFGPLAVHTLYQGRGIGKILLEHFCDYLDASGQTGYLETDKPENVSLYEKCGFTVIATDTISGAKNWFMVRKPTA